MKNILFVESSRSSSPGGSFHSMLLLVRGLKRKKCNLFILFYELNSLVHSFSQTGAYILPPLYSQTKYREINVLKDHHNPTIISRFIPRPIYKWRYYSDLRRFILKKNELIKIIRIIKEYNIDIVHLNNGITPNREGIIASKIAGTRCIVHERKIRNYNEIDVFLSKYISALIAISNAVSENCKKWSIRSTKLIRIYNPVEPKSIDKVIAKEIIDRHPDLPIISMIGNIIEWKGQLTFLKAINVLHNVYNKKFKALLVGGIKDQEYYEKLKLYVHEHNLDSIVNFIGYVHDVHNYMYASDIIVHASSTPEPFGRVIIEALSLGKVVVASNEGGPKEIIQDERNGLLFNSNNEEELAKKLNQILNGTFAIDGNFVSSQILEKYSLEKHVSKIRILYESL